MKKETYLSISDFMSKRPLLSKLSLCVNKIITIFIYIFFPSFLLTLLFVSEKVFWRIFLTTVISFLVLSIIRVIINFPRPYEKLGIKPLYSKGTKGHSFPSRHTFSIFIIAFSVLTINIPLGIIFICLGFLLGFLRVVCGVHFLRDVIAGFLFALISAIVGYIIL